MNLVMHDYFEQFNCIADRCKHNCCIGWEIDIDDDTLEKYACVSGELGHRLKTNISLDENAHFVLSNERCPFLNECGLCDIITQIGEEYLCQICTDHPRFRNYFDNRVEIGLGICCEEAARLILSNKNKVCLNFNDSNDEFFVFRQSVFEILQNRDISIDERLYHMLMFCGASENKKSILDWVAFFRKLERLDDSWDSMLDSIEDGVEYLPKKFDIVFEQLAIYFVYRHFANFDISACASFVCLSVKFIRAICASILLREKSLSVLDIAEVARMYSSEIEYSYENLDVILSAF